MIVTIHQPDFLPWLGFFDRWARADLYVVLDDVQFIRRGWQHRDLIKTAQGPAWLTVPVCKKGRFAERIRDVETEDGPWRRKHLATLHAAYARAPYFKSIFPLLEEAYAKEHRRLLDLNLDLLRLAAAQLGISRPLALASDAPQAESGSLRLVRLCQVHGADTYLTGQGSRNYLDEGAFRAAGVTVAWQDYVHPTYPQLHGPFVEKLSVLDYLMVDGRPLAAPGKQPTARLPFTAPL